jgi:3-deoxy-manno-octulosonate cytidylyltransferase (CMP-KDO synthetase)
VTHTLAVHPEAAVATLCTPITDPAQVFDPNAVKVVRDAEGFEV